MAKEFILPTERKKADSYNPRLFVLYGKPKSGKSSAIASLDNNLIIDLENGYRSLPVMDVQARTVSDLKGIQTALRKKIRETGGFPYRFITIDNATRLEEISLPYAAYKYRETEMGKRWGYKRDKNGNIIKDAEGKPIIDPDADIRKLPNGGGYLYLREALKELVHMFLPLCETLILVCHVKDKQIQIDGEEITEMQVDLAGKLADIICGEADAVGYLFREKNKNYISFEGGDNAIKEARPKHLRGKRFLVGESDDDNNLTMDMSAIFNPEVSK